jgi:formate dehydrogenase major subunit
LGNVPAIVFVGPNRNATSEFAHILLPAAAWAEKDGTFTNFAGRVQRIGKAVEPLGDARPEWLILKRLGKALGVSVPYLDASDVFAAIGQSVPAFSGLNYETVGDAGAMLK